MRKLFTRLALILLAAFSVPVAFAQFAAQTYPQKWYFASDYGVWSIPGQQANTYSWPSSFCAQPSPAGSSFMPFATNAPVWIVDVTSPSSEVVTPSAVTASPSCSFTASPANQHYSFSVRSGTGGLQEALNSISSSNAYSVIVYLDRNWYSAVASTPGATPASVIAAAKGSAAANLVDITTSPYTQYTWNGTAYTQNGAPALFNSRVSSNTAVSAPTALSTAAATNGLITTGTTGGTIPASSTYRLAATYVDASGGETLISTDSASTSTIATGSGSTNTLSVTSPAALAGAVGWRLYVTAASGSTGTEILYAPTCTAVSNTLPGVCAIGSTATVTAIVTGTATVPVVDTAYPRVGGASGSYSPFTALGAVAAASTGTLGTINLPAGYLNSLGKSLEVCGNGFATTNSTPGTLTFATTLASVPGVTSITPFTAVSGSTSASAQVPFQFCVTYTTAATGATGTLETHGWIGYGLAGTAPLTMAGDIIFTVSSTVDLTKADQLAFTIKPTTTALTAAQLRQVNIYPSN